MPNATDIAKNLSEKSDQELTSVLENPDDWLPQAVEFARAELARRGVSVKSIDQRIIAEAQQKESLNRPKEQKSFKDEFLRVDRFYRINGIGTTLIGRRDFRCDGTHLTTAWFTFFYLPICPIRSFRIRSFGNNSFNIVEKRPLNLRQVMATYLYTFFCLGWIYGLFALCWIYGLSDDPKMSAETTVFVFIIGLIPPVLVPIFLRHYEEKEEFNK